MTNYITSHGMQVDADLYQFVNEQAIPGTGVNPATFWSGFADVINDLTPINRALLARRDELQARIDGWHQEHRGETHDPAAYKAFLQEIGYLVPEGAPFSVTTGNVDPEIAGIAGPQLVVPVSNARFALKAANARWGSLLDTLCGSDVISEQNGCERSIDFNPLRVRGFAKDVPAEKIVHPGFTREFALGRVAIVCVFVIHNCDASRLRLREAGSALWRAPSFPG